MRILINTKNGVAKNATSVYFGIRVEEGLEQNESSNRPVRIVQNVVEIADYLRVSESTIRRLIRERRIPFFQIEGRYLFYVPSVNDWAAGLVTKSAPAQPTSSPVKKADELWKKVNSKPKGKE